MDGNWKREFIRREAAKVAREVAYQLQQEYKKHIDGVWWLWTMGAAVRPLTSRELQEAIDRGDIQHE